VVRTLKAGSVEYRRVSALQWSEHGRQVVWSIGG